MNRQSTSSALNRLSGVWREVRARAEGIVHGRLAGHFTGPVSAVVKASILDAPYLAATLPHMLSQARYPFAERIVVVDPRTDFEGKYLGRSRGTRADLDLVLDALMKEGTIDRIVDVDSSSDIRAKVTEQYFGSDAPLIPTHADTGGPIYSTLFGMEAAQYDHLVQFDSDMLFHASGGSWVTAAFDVIERDPSAWLVMTHAGPPVASVKSANSLASSNVDRARWNAKLGLWQFRSASTRYFACDRRRMYGKLRHLPAGDGCERLEVCIGDALERFGAYRGSIAMKGSWHLHPHSHEPPFADWAESLAAAVERGEVPKLQRGEYDLRLDDPVVYDAWHDQIFGNRWITIPPSGSSASNARDVPSSPPAIAHWVHRQVETGTAPICVVLPLRNRAGQDIRNALSSLRWQTAGAPHQTILVSQGSDAGINSQLASMAKAEDVSLIAVGAPSDPWCKSLALNTGIRACDPGIESLMMMDADMILAENLLEAVLDVLGEKPSIVLCQSRDLAQDASIPSEPKALREAFDALQGSARLRPRYGTGGIQGLNRKFLMDARGYDEDMIWWGSQDTDMVRRAQLAGHEPTWITDRSAILHQWHPKKHSVLDDPDQKREAESAWKRNEILAFERAGRILRNPERWGAALATETDSEI